MGITFRDGHYLKFVRMGGRTIKDGEAASIWNNKGEHQQIIGPKRVFLFYSTIRFLTHYKAEAHQYLKIMKRDGTVEHVPGPTSVFASPQDKIKVLENYPLQENESLVVTTMVVTNNNKTMSHNDNDDMFPNKNNKKINTADHHHEESRYRIVRGPQIFTPSPTDVIHKFDWVTGSAFTGTSGVSSSSSSSSSSETISPHYLKMNTTRQWKLKIPITYKELGNITINLAVTYKLVSEHKLLAVEDPMESMKSAIVADVHNAMFVQNNNNNNNNNETTSNDDNNTKYIRKIFKDCNSVFTNLSRTATNHCGIEIINVKFLGIDHDPILVAQQDRLKSQELELEQRRKKMEHEAEMDRQRAKNKANYANEVFEQEINELQRSIELEQMKSKASLEIRKQQDQVTLDFLGDLQTKGVDLSKFMCTPAGKDMVAETVLARSPTLVGGEQK